MGEEPPPNTPSTPNLPKPEILAFDYHPAWGIIGVTFGILVILAAGFYEQRTLNSRPLANVLHGFGEAPDWADSVTIYSRQLPRDEFPNVYDAVEEFRNSAQGQTRDDVEAFIQAAGIMETERIIAVPFTEDELRPALASGRLPNPGEAELLAGVNARLDSFKIDGQTFEVVGRLRRTASVFHFAYLIPQHSAWQPMFEEHPTTEKGWLDPNGRKNLRSRHAAAHDFADYDFEALRVPTDPRVTAAAISGLMLVAVFGAMTHLSLFRVIYPMRCGPLKPAFRVILTRPRLVIGMHLLLFGTFFATKLLATRMPIPNLWIMNLVSHAFEDGDLRYVAEAYASGNIPLAAWATFVNNYILQTLALTFAISLVIPFIGILKTLLSFTLVGFAMSPIWSGMAITFSFHSITMTLELEAYIIACTIVAFFWLHIGFVIFKGGFTKRVKESFLALLSGILLTAIMLAGAALYEAASLIVAAH